MTDDEILKAYNTAVDAAMDRAYERDGFASNLSRESRVAGLRAVERAAAARALDWAAEHLSDGLRYEDILEINSWEAVTVCAGIVRARAEAYRQEMGEQ